MKKANYNKFLAMLRNEAEFYVFHHKDHYMIIAPGRFAAAFPLNVYEIFLSGTPATPLNIAYGTGVKVTSGGRGKKAWRHFEEVTIDNYNSIVLQALKGLAA
ncbi:MAG: hypothetical protein IJR00_08125 [Lachnospiraceae bacterium]|nr:hypothetical protein [Lachnospiraceae bacterium]